MLPPLELTKAALSSTLDGKALNGAVVKNTKDHLLRVSNNRRHLGALTSSVWWLASTPCNARLLKPYGYFATDQTCVKLSR